jgi:ABC-type bacteriocin/lantibiotic exporter with double-glycine peptidase domain
MLPSVGMAAPVLAALPEPMVGKRQLRELHGAVGFSGVNFRYTEDSPWVLSDFSLKIKAGEYLGIVGSTGAGKSSLVKLLLGLLQHSQGRINFDQTDLRLLDLDRLREQFGVVLQDCRLIPGSILENIAAGREVELDKVLTALESVGLGEFIQGLPMGVHTMIGESATGFSGGQIQLLALARALVGEPRLLLFDEPTSALDNASVSKIGKVLSSLKITRIIISHRLGTLQSCDRIVVLDQGRIVQQGRYEELANQPGLFQQLLH